MAVVNLTKREVDAAQPREREWCLWDQQLSGFGLRVRPSGVKTYVVTYRAGHGRQAPIRRYTIGRHGAPWTPEQVRREAKRVLGEVVPPARTRRRSASALAALPGRRRPRRRPLYAYLESGPLRR
jgi:Arm DNA-binding domain